MIKKEKFTPGPWHILVPKPRYGKRACHSIVDGDGEYVAKPVAVSKLRGRTACKIEERKANERLIAAAPEMYDALKDCIEAMSCAVDCTLLPEYLNNMLKESLEKATQAVKKARGEE